MRPEVVQTLWAELIAATLRDCGVTLCVISPGSRSTPLVAALGRTTGVETVTIIDERAAAFYALGAARATGNPAALVCTSGSAAAHYLPAIVETAHAGVPLIAITADRPPELHDCGASQTIDQHAIYGGFVRGAFDLGAPIGEPLALRALRRKIIQAVTLARGPDAGPVHLNAPFKKPLEPAAPSTDTERALAAHCERLIADRPLVAPPKLAPDPAALATLAQAIAGEPRGVIVVGALPIGVAGEAVFELARRAGYTIVAEAGSQLQLRARPDDIVVVDHFDLAAPPTPALIVQLGAEPVAAAWPAFLSRAVHERGATRYVLAGARWNDPDSSADGVILGEIGEALRALAGELARATKDRASSRRSIERASATLGWEADWRAAESAARRALAISLARHTDTEVHALAAALEALPPDAILQVGNSLPIRVIDHALAHRSPQTTSNLVITQRGAAGIDGLIASAAGATRAGKPVLLVVGDVSFAHDLGGLLAARAALAPLAILVIDNGGGQIFGALPVGNAGLGEAFDRHWLTPPQVDVPAIARALGGCASTLASPAGVGGAIASALATPGTTVSHAPVAAAGARDVRTTARELASRLQLGATETEPGAHLGTAEAQIEPAARNLPSQVPREPLAPTARIGGLP